MIHTFLRLHCILILTLCFSSGYAADMKPSDKNIGKGFIPQSGFVPDSATAIKVAVAILIPIYGAETICSEYPFIAVLANGVWTVSGSIPAGQVGGAAEVRISKATGQILRVVHFK